MAVSKRLRYEVLRRDNHTCRYCGATAPDVPLRIDHVTPVALGGTDTPDNLVTACQDCNSGKSSATVDAAVVVSVSDDALRWAEAMKQAAEDLRQQERPKAEYRTAFKAAWDSWTFERNNKKETVELPAAWKTSIENFRQAGLPAEVWPDIVEKAMTNETVRNDNAFRYSCGIAWRMVRELHDRAKAITGTGKDTPQAFDSVVQAAIDVWIEERFGEVDPDALNGFRLSIGHLREDHDPDRVLLAARYAAWHGESDAVIALQGADREDALTQWTLAWFAATGEYPDEARTERIEAQINTLLAADVYVKRIAKAAAYAGSRCISSLRFGLSEEEQGLIGTNAYLVESIEIWSEAFRSSAGRRPETPERAAFLDSLQRIGKDGDIWIADVHTAAAAAGAYQDSEISTCLTRHLSVFEAAARPLAPAA